MTLVMAFASGLVAVGLYPAVAGAGRAVSRFDDQLLGSGVPTKIKLPALPERSTIYAADGSVLATLFLDQNRVYVPLSDVNDVTRKAVLAIEDHSFYRHGPLDVPSIVRAGLSVGTGEQRTDGRLTRTGRRSSEACTNRCSS